MRPQNPNDALWPAATVKPVASEGAHDGLVTAGSLLSVTPDQILLISKGGGCLSLEIPGGGVTPTEPAGSREVSLRDILPDELAEDLASLLTRTLQSGRPQVYGRQIVTDGDSRDYEVVMVPVGCEDAVTFVHDVTRRKRLEERMLQLQRIESFAHFAGGAAHDFNNLLTAIVGYCQLATRAQGRVDTLLTSVQEIEKVAQRGAELCRQMLLFSGRQTAESQMVSLNDLVQGTGAMLGRLIGEDIELVMRLKPDVGLMKVDPGQFEQVLVNLVSNARDAMPDGGILTIETANVRSEDASPGSGVPGAAPGEYVELAVSDTGTGVNPDVEGRVFEPFYTTKKRGEGTGLGLFICHRIVTEHAGHIDVQSEPGRGTTFRVYLPRLWLALGPEPGGEGAAPGGGETVLLVEDDQVVRSVAADALRQHGYTVLEAGDGVEALDVAESYGDRRVDLLFTDVVLPLMNGRELASRLRTVLPDFKVLYTSGYTREAIERIGRPEQGSAFIEKPFTPVELAQKVRAVLEG